MCFTIGMVFRQFWTTIYYVLPLIISLPLANSMSVMRCMRYGINVSLRNRSICRQKHEPSRMSGKTSPPIMSRLHQVGLCCNYACLCKIVKILHARPNANITTNANVTTNCVGRWNNPNMGLVLMGFTISTNPAWPRSGLKWGWCWWGWWISHK